MNSYGDQVAADIMRDSARIPVSVTALLRECRSTADTLWSTVSELEEKLEPVRQPRPIVGVPKNGEDAPKPTRSPLLDEVDALLRRLHEIQGRVASLGGQLEL